MGRLKACSRGFLLKVEITWYSEEEKLCNSFDNNHVVKFWKKNHVFTKQNILPKMSRVCSFKKQTFLLSIVTKGIWVLNC